MHRAFHTAVVLALAPLVPATTAFAADNAVIEEIVVTATKRETTTQDVPFSLNVQTGDDIQRSGATNIEELSRNIAGLSIQNLGPGQSQVAIRGVSAGQIVRDQPGVKEQVGVYLDESVVSLSLFTPDFDLYDLNRVETLRGPQGTLFGSGSVGGTIRYITNQPNPEAFEASVEASMNKVTDGDVGGSLKGMVNIPLADTLALRVVGYSTQYSGFIDALTDNGRIKDVNDGDRTGFRASLRFEPNDMIAITPRVIFQDIETDGFNRQEFYNLYANPFTTTRPAIRMEEREQFLLLREGFEDETLLADLTIEVSLDAFDITSVTSYLERDILVSRDASALTGSVTVDLGFAPAAILLPSNLLDTTDLEQLTQELRFSSNGEGPFHWVAGAFYSEVDRVYAQRLPTPGYDVFTNLRFGAGTTAAVANGYGPDSPFNSDLPYDIKQLAFFGEVTWELTDDFAVTVGGRYYDFEEERSITSGGLFANGDRGRIDKTSSDGFNARVLAAWALTENVTVNAQAAQGFRLGGVNDPLNASICSPGDRATFGSFQAYDDETMWNYELGIKGEFDRVRFAAAIFYSDIEDLQVTLDAGSCSSRISFNVEEAHATGFEFEVAFDATEQLELSLSGTVVESEFDTTVRAATGGVLGGVEKGNRFASVPEVQVTAGATWTQPTELLGGADFFVTGVVQWVGDHITQPSDQVDGAGLFRSRLAFAGATGNETTNLNLELSQYSIANIQAGFATESWEALLFVNNLSDENAELAFDRERGGRARLGFHTNTPRTVGVTYRLFF
jgi:outer membrane receptor protein involved in Fe transport